MPTSPSCPTSLTCVVPVIDYEPLSDAYPPLTCRTDSTDSAPPRARPTSPDAARIRAAAAFADAALRRVLEVVDRRRPAAQLRPLLAAGLLDTLLISPPHRGAQHNGPQHNDRGTGAHLRRVRVQLDEPAGISAEVSASYSRGDRIHAIACRIEQVRTPTGARWEVVALHLG